MKLSPAALCLLLAASASAQIFTLSREQLLQYTEKNPYGRFPDGRPKVPDEVLEKLQAMSAEEVLPIVRKGFPNQYASGFRILNPRKNLVGRAMTVMLMPSRPDVSDVNQAKWKAQGNAKPYNHQTALDQLQKGDVFVADAFGNSNAGGIIGDNLAYFIWKTTQAGFVIDGAIRDLNSIQTFGMGGYFRDAVPEAIRDVMVAGINVPVRIGKVTVLPGDVVFGDSEGVYFIPPHLVQDLVDEAEITHIHDEWTKKKFDEGKYKSTDIYSRPSDPALIREYEEYLKQRIGSKRFEEYKRKQAAR